jgi:hypothetical protein
MTGTLTSTDPRARAREVAETRASGARVSIRDLPAGAQLVNVMGVDYIHTVTENSGDLYLTSEGFAQANHLQPDSWYDLTWFRAHREELDGTGAVYACPSKPIDGDCLVVVVKFSRVGQKVPIETKAIRDLLSCEFNGPFEEFALVEELRRSRRGPEGLVVRTQVPLAIYVPPDKWQPSQTGRFQWRIANKVAKHPGIAIDILRDYIMVYGWLPGVDVCEAEAMGWLTHEQVLTMNQRATDEAAAKGFQVLDMKPAHVIVQVADRERLVMEGGRIEYGLVDFELLERTPDYEREIVKDRHRWYQRRRREMKLTTLDGGEEPKPLPDHLRVMRILGVDYLYGHCESTGGVLWVVGRDPDLFDFYLPERWRTTPQIRLFDNHETYLTTSKDAVRLVWKVSRVGEYPEIAAYGPNGFALLALGFNSPFEEVGLAYWLRRNGVRTILPRAVYRTGHRSQLKESLFDPSRYRSHRGLRSPDGEPILETGRNYVTIWDQWDGPVHLDDETEATVYRSVNAAEAVDRGLLAFEEGVELAAAVGRRFDAIGIEAPMLRLEHLLLSIGPDEQLVRGDDGEPDFRLCNLQFLRWRTVPEELRGDEHA